MLLCESFHIEYLYGCKAVDEERQDLSCTCMKLQQKGKFNCTCFADDQVEMDEHYLNCHDALKKGQLQSGVYLLKPDNMAPFEVHNNVVTQYYYNIVIFDIVKMQINTTVTLNSCINFNLYTHIHYIGLL